MRAWLSISTVKLCLVDLVSKTVRLLFELLHTSSQTRLLINVSVIQGRELFLIAVL